MLQLNSNITIGSFQFSGVHEVVISRSIHSAVDKAVITLPSIAKIFRDGKSSPDMVTTGNQFNEGDAVTIQLGYNGVLQTEFQGFVQRRDMNMPLAVTCEGYSWLLKRNTVNISEQNISVLDLLLAAVSGLDAGYNISVTCRINCVLSNVQVVGNGLDVINAIHQYTDGCLSCFFIAPGVLWCGPVYMAYGQGIDVFALGNVAYRLGYNVLKDNSLKVRTTDDDPVTVQYRKRVGGGALVTGISNIFSNAPRIYRHILNQVADSGTLLELANEKACRINYGGYEGSVEPFLQPAVLPGYQAYITDARYPEQDGTYLVEGVTTTFGTRGARRVVEIGPMIGFFHAGPKG